MRAFICVLVAFAASRVSGYSMYAMRVPNGDKVPGVTALGHLDPILAGPMNEFGMDMIDADFHWTKDFCMKDSDGDGQTNGQELGDPCCEFVHRKNPKVRWTEGVSHPGDASLKSDPKLWEGIVCEETGDTAVNTSVQEAKTEVVEKTTVVQAETVTEDTEEPVKVSSQKTEGANETAEEEAPTAATDEAVGAEPPLFSSSLISAVVLLGLLAFVVVRMRRRRSQWTLLPQQGRRTQ